MKRFLRFLPLVLVIVAGVGFTLRYQRLRQVRYTVTLLKAPGDNRCAPMGLNDAGTVVVTTDSAPDSRSGAYTAFGYSCSGGGVSLLEPGEHATLRAVNARGDVAGWLGNPKAYPRRAALWRGGRRIALSPDALDSEAHALNDAGLVVGSVSIGRDYQYARQYAALWRNGQLTNLGRWPGTEDGHSVANDINGGGVVVGSACGPGYRRNELLDIHMPAFSEAGVWKAGRFTLLPKPPGRARRSHAETNALAVNDRGRIVGYDVGNTVRAVLWDDAGARVLSLPRPCDSVATDINNAGQIVGTAVLKSTWEADWRQWRTPRRIFRRVYVTPSAVLWEDGKPGSDLNDLIPPLSGWNLGRALAINNRGQIAGVGLYKGRMRAFLLTPAPSR